MTTSVDGWGVRGIASLALNFPQTLTDRLEIVSRTRTGRRLNGIGGHHHSSGSAYSLGRARLAGEAIVEGAEVGRASAPSLGRSRLTCLSSVAPGKFTA
jgi:hypothetical protein